MAVEAVAPATAVRRTTVAAVPTALGRAEAAAVEVRGVTPVRVAVAVPELATLGLLTAADVAVLPVEEVVDPATEARLAAMLEVVPAAPVTGGFLTAEVVDAAVPVVPATERLSGVPVEEVVVARAGEEGAAEDEEAALESLAEAVVAVPVLAAVAVRAAVVVAGVVRAAPTEGLAAAAVRAAAVVVPAVVRAAGVVEEATLDRGAVLVAVVDEASEGRAPGRAAVVVVEEATPVRLAATPG